MKHFEVNPIWNLLIVLWNNHGVMLKEITFVSQIEQNRTFQIVFSV